MTDAAAGGNAGGSVYSKDYWDNVFEQVGHRPMVKIALAVLAFLYGTAIYAPLVANDRPYVLEATDSKAYQRSLSMLRGVTGSINSLLKKGEEGFLEKRKEDDDRTYSDAIKAETDTLVTHLAIIRSNVPADRQAALDELESEINGAVAAGLGGDSEEAVRLAGLAKDRSKAIKSELKPADPEDPDAGGVELVPKTTYPILEATTSIEVFFMWLWALVLTWPLWNAFVNRVILARDRERIRKARKPKLAAVLGSSFVAAFAWSFLVGGQLTFETSLYKEQLTKGELVAERVVFPPISNGFAETHMTEVLRPPTWHSSSEINDEGYYVRGLWKPQVDPISGELPPAKPVEVRVSEPERNAASRLLLGSDTLGRDLLVRILYGGRISLAVGILSTFLLVTIGVIVGAVAGYFGGWVDIAISRLIEIVQSFPAFFLILVAVAVAPDVLHPIVSIVIMIALVRWTGVARLVRGEFLRLREQEFVIAAQALGFSNRRVIFRHVLPNALGPVLVAAAFSVAAGILTESAISFLGFGVQHPVPSWGALLTDARGQFEYWWLQIAPGFLIFVTVFCYNIVGEGVRDALDPRRKAS